MSTSNSKYEWATIGSSASPLYIFAPARFQLDDSLESKIAEKFQQDKRVATLSLGYHPSQSHSDYRVNSPFGAVFIVNGSLQELVGPLDLSSSEQSQISHWADEASRRGLFHYWAPWLSSDLPALVEMSPADQLEATDSLTPLGNFLNSYSGTPLTILVDCAWLGASETGSQKATVEILRHMALDNRVAKISLFDLPNGLPDYALDLGNLAKISIGSLPRANYQDVLWRPYQPSADIDFREINEHARRIVMTYLDLIAYSNKKYHESQDSWLGYRSTLRLIAARCDAVVAISNDVRNQILENFAQLNPDRIFSVPLGMDHTSTQIAQGNSNVLTIDGTSIKKNSYILCLGTNFSHKNRDFAIEVVKQLRQHGNDLKLVFAGLILDQHTSGETSVKVQTKNLPGWVDELGSVSSDERDWLLSNAIVALYPTSAEGFGLVPFEAAASGTPIAATRFGPLDELLPRDVGIANWTIKDYVDEIVQLTHESNAKKQVDEILSSAQNFTWEKTASQLVDIFIQISKMEKNPANMASAEFEKQLHVAQVRFNSEVLAITKSLSWKITAPIRILHKKLIGQ